MTGQLTGPGRYHTVTDHLRLTSSLKLAKAKLKRSKAIFDAYFSKVARLKR